MKASTSYDKALVALDPVFKDKALSRTFTRMRTDKSLKLEAERKFADQIMLRNEKVTDAALANPASLANALMDMAIIGVSLSPTLGHAYLIPEFTNGIATVNAMISYKGLENLAVKHGAVKAIQTELVYSKDTFEMGTDATGPYVKFSMARGDRGNLQGGFCRAKLANGEVHVEWMSAEEIEGCHQAAIAKQKKEPFTWKGAFKGEMMKKCIVRRAAKHWQLSQNMVGVLAAMDTQDPMSFKESDHKAIASNNVATVLISDKHIKAIQRTLTELGYSEETAGRWMDMKAKAWGHQGIDTYPDESWEKLRDALVERHTTVERLRAEAANKTDTPA